MIRLRPISARPNLSERQQFTQRLAEQFNADERVWADLAPLRLLRRLLQPGMSPRRRKQQDLADFARAQPPQEAVAMWKVEP